MRGCISHIPTGFAPARIDNNVSYHYANQWFGFSTIWGKFCFEITARTRQAQFGHFTSKTRFSFKKGSSTPQPPWVRHCSSPNQSKTAWPTNYQELKTKTQHNCSYSPLEFSELGNKIIFSNFFKCFASVAVAHRGGYGGRRPPFETELLFLK